MAEFIADRDYNDGQPLTEAHLDAVKSSIETFVNTTKLSSDNIQTGGVSTACINNLAVTTAKIADGAVTRTKLEALGHQISSADSGSFALTSTTFTDVTNLTVTITTTGRPVLIYFYSNSTDTSGAGISGIFSADSNADTSGSIGLRIMRDATDIAYFSAGTQATGHTDNIIVIPASTIFHFDPVAAGTYTYKLQIRSSAAAVEVKATDVMMMAHEV